MGHYDVLGVRPDASAGQIRAAYVRLAREHHPDRAGGSTERMQAVNVAWAVLRDPGARLDYDRTLRATAPRPRPVWTEASAPPEPPEPHRPDLDDLDDDRPFSAGVVRLPPWLAMVPPGMLLLAAIVFLLGLIARLAPLIALAAVFGLLGVMCFVVSPFVALSASRRRPR